VPPPPSASARAPAPAAPRQRERRPSPHGLHGRALGLALIFLTAGIWVASSFVSELLVSAKARDQGDDAKTKRHVPPLVLTYLATSLFSVFLPLVRARRWWRRRRRAIRGGGGASRVGVAYAPIGGAGGGGGDADNNNGRAAAATDLGDNEGGEGGVLRFEPDVPPGGDEGADVDTNTNNASAEEDQDELAADREAWRAALRCSALWFGAQWLFNISLSLTSVTVNTVLSSSSSIFTFALSMIALREPYSRAKAAALAACVAGTVIVTLSDARSGEDGSSPVPSPSPSPGPPSPSPSPAPLGLTGTTGRGSSLSALFDGASGGSNPLAGLAGDVACLLSAVLYAGYTVTLRAALPDDEEAELEAFFGYVGLLCSCGGFPLVAGAVLLGRWHPLSTPLSAYGLILLEGILDYALSDYLWARAVLLLGPTLATMGLSAQIPVAAAAELITGRASWARSPGALVSTLVGTALILAGFFGGNAAASKEAVPGEHHRQHEDGGGFGGGFGGGGGNGGNDGGDNNSNDNNNSGPSTPRRQRRRDEWATVAAAGLPPGLSTAGSVGVGGERAGGGTGGPAPPPPPPAAAAAAPLPPPAAAALPPPLPTSKTAGYLSTSLSGGEFQEVELQAVSGGGGGGGAGGAFGASAAAGLNGSGMSAAVSPQHLHRLARETR
jgi:solute carrier family 35 protein F5